MGLKIYALLPLYIYLLRIKPWVNTQPQLMGNDKRNEWKRQFSTKAGTPKLCVCGWHMALRFMGWPYPSSKSSFEFSTKEKVSRVRPHRVQSERKDCPHINCGSAKKSSGANNERQRMWEEQSTPITSELWWKRLCHFSDRSLEWFGIHRAVECPLNEQLHWHAIK